MKCALLSLRKFSRGPLVATSSAADAVVLADLEDLAAHAAGDLGHGRSALLTRQHELSDKRGMVPRHLLLICCPDDVGAHSPQHDADVHAGIGEMC
jgi:hypothetical protein